MSLNKTAYTVYIYFGVPEPRIAEAAVAEGRLHMLSGGSLRLTCDVPADPSPLWTYDWFFNGQPLTSGQSYSIWKARVLQSGNYTCAGARESELSLSGILETQPSAPLRVDIDGNVIKISVDYHLFCLI